MIGKCPNCGISLTEPPFENRETNEVVITLKYRKILDNDMKPKPVNESGICEICDATVEIINLQKKFI